jgi:O-antigen ligase
MQNISHQPKLFPVLLSGLFLTLLVFFSYNHFGFNWKAIVVMTFLPFALVSVIHIDLAILAAITLLYLQTDLLSYRVAVFGFVPIVLASIFTFKIIPTCQKNRNPILMQFFLYIILIMPSLLNCSNVPMAFVRLFNLFSMSLVFIIIGNLITSYKQIKLFIIAYIVLTALNGISVLYLAANGGGRVFGFMGVTYVDFVCIAILIVLMVMLYFKQKYILPFSLITMFFIISFFATQTRGPALVLVIALCIGSLLLFLHSEKFDISKKRLSYTFLIGLIISISFIGLSFALLPDVTKRFSELSASNNISLSDFKSFGKSSLITRLLIWLTSLNAFMQHPFIGIGAYSFPFESIRYNVLPLQLYKMFVEGLSPHVTYLAVVTETGIIGLSGFLFFLFASIRMTYSSFIRASNKTQLHFSFGILIVQIFIAFAMCISDAWEWGQCGMLWSFVLGIAIANYHIVGKSTNT